MWQNGEMLRAVELGAPPIQEKYEASEWVWQWGSKASQETTEKGIWGQGERELLSMVSQQAAKE